MIQAQTGALAQAARAAGFAPSIHNTQPWAWRVRGSSLELRAQRDRQLAVTDPDGRMLTISCGTALHHARVVLAAEGWAARVDRLPDLDEPDLLARLTLTGTTWVTPAAVRHLQTMRIRHTDRRPVTDTPVAPESVQALRHVCDAEQTRLHVLRRDDVLDLAAAADQAQRYEAMDPSWTEELAYWAGGSRTDPSRAGGLGVPEDAIPDRPPLTTVPGRDFGQGGSLPVGTDHDQAAVYAILYGDDDSPRGWLQAGEALSAMWLCAIELDLTVLPLSAAIEVPSTRHVLKRLLAGIGQPYLAVRLGTADPDHAGPPHTPRLPAEQVVEVIPDSAEQ